MKRKEITAKEISRVLGIPSSEERDFIENIFENIKYVQIDPFPMIISEPDKYFQCEFLYKDCLGGDLDENKFAKVEERLHECIETFWLYNATYVGIFLKGYYTEYEYDIDEIECYYPNKDREMFRTQKEMVLHLNEQCGNDIYTLVEDVETIRTVLFLGTRDVANLVFYFKQFEMLVYISGCHAQVFTLNESAQKILERIVQTKGLFILE